jgi:hypothetical protein
MKRAAPLPAGGAVLLAALLAGAAAANAPRSCRATSPMQQVALVEDAAGRALQAVDLPLQRC